MADVVEDLLGSFLISLLVSLAHGAAHVGFGSMDAFAQAGVTPAGVAVFLTAFATSFYYNRVGWKQMEELL